MAKQNRVKPLKELEIWKWELPSREIDLVIPPPGRVVKVAVQQVNHIDRHTLWAIVDPKANGVPRKFKVVGTGQSFNSEWEYVDTWFDNPFVWHLFEVN